MQQKQHGSFSPKVRGITFSSQKPRNANRKNEMNIIMKPVEKAKLFTGVPMLLHVRPYLLVSCLPKLMAIIYMAT